MKEQILKGDSDLGAALDAARLQHATAEQVANAAGKIGVSPGDVRAFARGTNIFVPPGKGVGLGTLAHEVAHVNQFLTVRNFGQAYSAAFSRGLAHAHSLGLTGNAAIRFGYRINRFEISARHIQDAVLAANR